MDHSIKIVIVDDDEEMRLLLSDFLSAKGYELKLFASALDAYQYLVPASKKASPFEPKHPELSPPECDLVLTDIKMPGMNGLDFTTELHQRRPEVPIIVITAFGSIETAIDAMRRGAFHYLVKPFKLTEISVIVDKAIHLRDLERQNTTLREAVLKNWSLKGLIGKSQMMQNTFDLIQRVAPAQSNVLITGESGTGKEMVAKAIHELSPRKNKPFIPINCTAIPEQLLESELFGHAKGSFTGAIQRKKGLFEEAEGGTFFLDEIGDLSLPLQAKLLRVLQEKKIRAVGDNQIKDIDVRIVAATNKDLKKLIQEGCFREDLYYRLSVIPISIPPLRERKEDIPLLAQYFLKKYSTLNHSEAKTFDSEAMETLLTLPWSGNVRELENRIERACVLARSKKITKQDLTIDKEHNPFPQFEDLTNNRPTLFELEKRYIQKVIEQTGQHKEKAAQILGINRRTLYRKEKEYGWLTSSSSEPELTPSEEEK